MGPPSVPEEAGMTALVTLARGCIAAVDGGARVRPAR